MENKVFIVASPLETNGAKTILGYDVIYSGIGKINATIATMKAYNSGYNTIINIGSCGSKTLFKVLDRSIKVSIQLFDVLSRRRCFTLCLLTSSLVWGPSTQARYTSWSYFKKFSIAISSRDFPPKKSLTFLFGHRDELNLKGIIIFI